MNENECSKNVWLSLRLDEAEDNLYLLSTL